MPIVAAITPPPTPGPKYANDDVAIKQKIVELRINLNMFYFLPLI